MEAWKREPQFRAFFKALIDIPKAALAESYPK
jgi:hypothetical protein